MSKTTYSGWIRLLRSWRTYPEAGTELQVNPTKVRQLVEDGFAEALPGAPGTRKSARNTKVKANKIATK